MKLNLQFDDARWKASATNLSAKVKEVIRIIEDSHNVSGTALTIKFTDDALVKSLNARFRGKDKPTNVLSFYNEDAPLGDICLAYETVQREAKEQNKTVLRHALHLVAHGTLHLLGYDHESEDDADIMEAEEITILERMGIENPYIAR